MTTIYTCLIQREGKPTLIATATSEEQLLQKLNREMTHELDEEDFQTLLVDTYLYFKPFSATQYLVPYNLVLDTVEL